MAQTTSYSVETSEPQNEPALSGKPRRSLYAAGSEVTSLLGVKTTFEAFKLSVQMHPDSNCLGRRIMSSDNKETYLWESYNKVYDRVISFGSGLQAYGILKGSLIGVCCRSCPEWVIAEQACYGYGLIVVPMFDNLRPSTFQHIINETKMSVLITTSDKIELLLMDREKFPHLKTIILIDDVTEGNRDTARKVDLFLHQFGEVEVAGKKDQREVTSGVSETVVSVVYKAGTSTISQGVMLTNTNLMAVMGGLETLGSNDAFVKFTKTDVYFSYQSMAQLSERILISLVLFQGGQVGFFHGDFGKIFDDCMALKPTIISSVPGIMSSLHEELMAESEDSGPLSNAFFNFAVKGKRKNLRHGKLDHFLFDKLAFKRVHHSFGGRVRALLFGGTPSSPEVTDFFRVALGCEMYELYGLSETCGIATVTAKGDYETGHVGAPIPGTEVKLVQDNFGHSPSEQTFPRGEICFRGKHVFRGYFTTGPGYIDQEGWFHSGDIGMFDTKGRLRILAGKEQIIKLKSGELVYPERVEAVYCKSKWVAWCFIDLDHTGESLLAVIVPEEEAVTVWAKDRKIISPMKELIKHPKLKNTIMKDLNKVATKANLGGHERARDIFVDDTVVSVENELLTPFYRTIRPNASRYFHVQLMELSEAQPEPEQPEQPEPSSVRRASHPNTSAPSPPQPRKSLDLGTQAVTTTTTIDTREVGTLSPSQPMSAISPQPQAPPATPATPAGGRVTEPFKNDNETKFKRDLQAVIEAHLSEPTLDKSEVETPQAETQQLPQAQSSLSPISG